MIEMKRFCIKQSLLSTESTPTFLVMEWVPGLFGDYVWTEIAEYRNKRDAERMLKKLQQHNNQPL